MATFYVRTTGNDANAGTSPGAAWRTINKAASAAGIGSGDSVIVEPGVYREVVTFAMTSPTVETKFIADVMGLVFGTVGEVILTAFLTDDNTAPSTSALITLAGRDFITFQSITMIGGSNATVACIDGTTTTSTNIRVLGCRLEGAGGVGRLISMSSTFGVALNLEVSGCTLAGRGIGILISGTTGTGADWDQAFTITNNQFFGVSSAGVSINSGGSSANYPGGGKVYNNTFFGGSNAVATTAPRVSTSIPCDCQNNHFLMQNTAGLNANTLGQITSDYNRFSGGAAARTNVNAGAHDIATAGAAGIDWFAGLKDGFARVIPMVPRAGGPLVGVGNPTVAPTLDYYGATRPNPPSIGHAEYATLSSGGGLGGSIFHGAITPGEAS